MKSFPRTEGDAVAETANSCLVVRPLIVIGRSIDVMAQDLPNDGVGLFGSLPD